MSPAKKQKYYAYFVPDGNLTGITTDWKETEAKVSGRTGARFKAFDSKDDAEAWLAGGAMYEAKRAPRLEPGIYFDAGTGRGAGVEVSVTDERGKDLLHKAVPRSELNRFGKHLVGNDEATNNYGELLALRYALEIAQAQGAKHVFGDSKLVIEYWSKWRIKRKELPQETVALADEVSKLREDFEKRGGSVGRISGDFNPADLGFHR
ncbi:MAG TPA: viroplasmin family protein [Candidatus Paceibacterota bacterium]|nr:viroplasmin family protein [Candidatus Paceibacterota bacterium]